MNDVNDLWGKVAELTAEVKSLRREFELKFDTVAPRGWVHDVLEPIKLSIGDIKNAVTSQAATVADLAVKMKMMFDSHDAFLKDKAEAEREDLKSRTPMGLVKKYAPVVLFILSLFTLFGIFRVLLEGWIKAVPR